MAAQLHWSISRDLVTVHISKAETEPLKINYLLGPEGVRKAVLPPPVGPAGSQAWKKSLRVWDQRWRGNTCKAETGALACRCSGRTFFSEEEGRSPKLLPVWPRVPVLEKRSQAGGLWSPAGVQMHLHGLWIQLVVPVGFWKGAGQQRSLESLGDLLFPAAGLKLHPQRTCRWF